MEQESLHDYLQKQHEGEVKNQIENDMQANRILDKYEQLREKKKLNKILARSELDRIKKWRDEVNAELDKQIDQYRKLIHAYIVHLREETKDPSLNKITLPYGTVIFQPQTSTWHYDEERLIKHFLETKQYQFLHIRLNRENMRKYFKETNSTIYDPKTGETLEGVIVEPQGEYFYVKKK